MNKKPYHRIFLQLMIGALFSILASTHIIQAADSSTNSEEEVISGDFSLSNQFGERVTQSTYQGFYRLVFFGFTECPDICPSTMYKVGKVMQQLGDASEAFKPIFISVDPENDTPERLAAYANAFHPSIAALTGSPEEIAAAAKGFNTTYGKNTDGSSGYYHSAYLYLMDQDGKLLDLFSFASSQEIILKRLQELL